ncbi:MAG TPA: hypothetical protein VHZ99_13725 [Steroidobacteraceae bacterium]|nr:hypothetical protein [Steroidobacteraceae bacterium]
MRMLRYCMPRVRRRGYGLGNELLPWARAFLASQVLDATLLPPAFGMNRRGYWRDFFTAPDDWIQHRALELLLPVVEFGEAEYLACGAGDVVQALRRFARERELYRRHGYVLVTEGLWGGFRHVEAARAFVRSTLHRSRYAPANLLKVYERLDRRRIVVAMHVRMGDFAPAMTAERYREVTNASLPIEWFCHVAEQLRAAYADDWQLLLITDGRPDQLEPLTSAFSCVSTADMNNNDCSDVLALADADLLVCSSSTYSSLAAFLSESPYLWFGPTLHAHPEGCYSTHGFTAERGYADGPTAAAVEQYVQLGSGAWDGRGVVVEMDGVIPPATLAAACRRRDARQAWSDLVRSGVAPAPAPR